MGAWERLHWLFETDDGALHDIRLSGLDESGVAAGFEFVRSQSRVTPDASFWHKSLERDEPEADYPDAARLVARGTAEAFHVLASGLKFAGAVVPDLGVFVWPDELTLDYRMGSEWGPSQLTALFELLRQLVAATSGRVSLGRHVLPHVDALFASEWHAYCAACAKHAEPGAAPDRGT